jgi:hypothetical protein
MTIVKPAWEPVGIMQGALAPPCPWPILEESDAMERGEAPPAAYVERVRAWEAGLVPSTTVLARWEAREPEFEPHQEGSFVAPARLVGIEPDVAIVELSVAILWESRGESPRVKYWQGHTLRLPRAGAPAWGPNNRIDSTERDYPARRA